MADDIIELDVSEDRIDVFDEVDESEELSEDTTESEKGETEVEVEVDTKPETEEVETEVETEEEVSPTSQDNESAGLKAALSAERSKRQDLEKQLASKVEAPDPLDDQDGYEAHIEQKYATKRINDSREDMIEAEPDFLEKEAVFMSLVMDADGNVTDTSLRDKFNAAKNPARFALNHVNEHLKLEALKSRDFDSEITVAVKKAEDALIKKLQDSGQISLTSVPDLTGATASGSNSEKIIASVENPGDLFQDNDGW